MDETINAAVENPSLIEDAGAVFCFGFPGTAVGELAKGHVLHRHVGSLILFRRNVESAQQVATLTQNLRALRPHNPPLIAVDQEGGAVARFRGITTDFPNMATLGATGDRGLAHAFGSILAEELTTLGIDFDFAPVVDVNSNPLNPVIGSRSFGTDPEEVGDLASAQIRGMEAGGLVACAKHFPGHGDTDVDSHRALPVIQHGLDRLRQVELVPFQKAIDANVPAIMTAHILFPSLDDTNPATLSKAILTGLLREEMGFEGVIVTDDLEMKAIATHPGVPEAAIQAIEAGADLVIISKTPALQIAAWEAVVAKAKNDEAFRKRLRDAANRVRNLNPLRFDGPYPHPSETASLLRGPNALFLSEDIQNKGCEALGDSPRDPDPTEAPL